MKTDLNHRFDPTGLIPYLPTNQQEDLRPLAEKIRNRKKPPTPSQLEELKPAFHAVISPRQWQEEYVALASPFSHSFLYLSAPMERALALNCPEDQDPEDQLEKSLLTSAYSLILRQHYGLSLPEDSRINQQFWTSPEEQRPFSLEMDTSFIRIECLHHQGHPLTEEEKQELLIRINRPQSLQELLPLQDFLFSGFIILKAREIQEEVTLTRIRETILQKGVLVRGHLFQAFQERIREYLGKPEITLTITALQGDKILLVSKGHRKTNACIYVNHETSISRRELEHSPLARALEEQQSLIFNDLTQNTECPFLENMVSRGIRSLQASPLLYGEEAIGSFLLTSPHPGTFNGLDITRIEEILPLTAAALRHSMEDFSAEVKTVMQQHFTAIHPAVEWRFVEAAKKVIAQKIAGEPPAIEDIRFDGVYPLYAATDIRGSSRHRNQAIRQDLYEQLALTRTILEEALKGEDLPVYREILYRINSLRQGMEERLDTGDEVQIVRFIREEVESHFDLLRQQTPALRELIDQYRGQLHTETGTLYRERKRFDDTVALINSRIGTLLEEEQVRAQAMFPHYFDKQSTDGVDHTLYIGAELSREKPYDTLYLRNLRLWQFLMVCRIAREMEALKTEMPLPLDTTHLIAVQDMPLSIAFDQEEKRFRVDGAYNIRYEIMKKRIDKAAVRESGERLTQPGRIAVVYSQQSEGEEYRRYAEYLTSLGLIEEGIEDLPLDDLQGIQGLRALRLTVSQQ